LDVTESILLTIGIILGGYAVVLLIMTLILKLKQKSVKKMWVRYLAWFLIIPPILIPLIYSTILFQAAIFIISFLAYKEYANVVGLWKDKYYTVFCYLGISVTFTVVFFNRFGLFQVMPIYLIMVSLLIPVMRGEFEHMIQKACLAILGVIYFGWFFAHIAFLKNVDNGVAYIFFLLILTEVNDASAYIFGKLFGKHKLLPKISPKKTNEGFLGGLLVVIGLSFLLKPITPEFEALHRTIYAAVIAVGGTCGDLVMSFIKRDLQIEDFGKILPGHGGLLDRFDSVVFVAPLFFHLVNLFYGIV
jgi:phosphatidate cytidylyltransferase